VHECFAAVLAEARRRQLLSADHVTVDGTRLEAWASLTSVQPRTPPPDGDDGAPPAASGGFHPGAHGEAAGAATRLRASAWARVRRGRPGERQRRREAPARHAAGLRTPLPCAERSA